MHFISAMDEPNLFFSMVIQYCMQAITIISTMKVRKMIPFIRDDISFRYFTMIFHSSIMREFSAQDYLNSYIPFVIQKAFDFSKYDYQFVKTQMGNGKMIHAILSNINESEISPDKIIKTVKDYIDHIQ